MRTWLFLSGVLGAVAFGLSGGPALAQLPCLPATLTDNWGLRKQLTDEGVQFAVCDIAETLSNPVGGIRQETIYDGQVTAAIELDLKKLFKWPDKWPDTTFHVDGYQISGRGLSQNAVGNLLTVSSIEALPTTRLHDLWLQQLYLW